jgi:hypothetical protein
MTKVTIDRELLERVAGMSKRSCLTAMDELRAILAHPTQQGEAVEVVAWLGGNGLHVDRHDATGAPFELLTVAQHQRILAASVPAGCMVVPVELLSFMDEAMCDFLGEDDPLREQLRALLAGAEGVKDE